MSTRLTRTSRWRMAVTFAVAYLLCVLAPAVALALVDGTAALHCLSGSHHHKATMVQANDVKPHHHDGDTHSHRADANHDAAAPHHHEAGPHSSNDGTDGNLQTATCCGLFCVSAMTANVLPDVGPEFGMLTAVAAFENGIAGRGPDRIDRPPNVLLPQ